MRTVLNILLIVLIFALAGCYSCQSWHDFWGDGPRGTYPPDKVFWDKECKPLVEAAPAKPVE
jgi:hypothetical protein